MSMEQNEALYEFAAIYLVLRLELVLAAVL